jgi:hypothetical protein
MFFILQLSDLSWGSQLPDLSVGGKDEDAGREAGLEDTARERSGTTLVQTEPLLTGWKVIEA